uniref:Uncharacterized protein n=1 Tax=Physcomitrium patens TaxID=3218 RepID=A0A2K1LBW7_PHYPA|nr:hypothetical protein PHYPA_001945 [Physcomitrium patens]
MTPVISCHTVSYLLLCRSHSLPWNYIESNMDNWVHPCPTLHEITEHAAAYLELLVLASGFQSSGQPFSWTPANLRKALAWASHLEQVRPLLNLLASGPLIPRPQFCSIAPSACSHPTALSLSPRTPTPNHIPQADCALGSGSRRCCVPACGLRRVCAHFGNSALGSRCEVLLLSSHVLDEPSVIRNVVWERSALTVVLKECN